MTIGTLYDDRDSFYDDWGLCYEDRGSCYDDRDSFYDDGGSCYDDRDSCYDTKGTRNSNLWTIVQQSLTWLFSLGGGGDGGTLTYAEHFAFP
jgi:hypothetical protein